MPGASFTEKPPPSPPPPPPATPTSGFVALAVLALLLLLLMVVVVASTVTATDAENCCGVRGSAPANHRPAPDCTAEAVIPAAALGPGLALVVDLRDVCGCCCGCCCGGGFGGDEDSTDRRWSLLFFSLLWLSSLL